MKLVLRILPTVFVLISSTAFADTTASGLFPQSLFLFGSNSNAFGELTGYPQDLQFEFVNISVEGVTPTGWFGPQQQQYFPGESVLGPTTITWTLDLEP
jgi:peptidoglycan/LPS O-acetylase OafA/YrhL